MPAALARFSAEVIGLSQATLQPPAVLARFDLYPPHGTDIIWPVQEQQGGEPGASIKNMDADKRAGSRKWNSPWRALRGIFVRRKPRVFISSTTLDLGPWREQVGAVLSDAGLHPLRMEEFPAIAKSPGAGSSAMVELSDVFVGLYARRYGTLTHDGISITEQEYDRAKDLGVPRLMFFLSDQASWPAEWIEDNPGAEKLAQLKDKIRSDVIPREFSTLEELQSEVRRAADFYLEKDAQKRRRRWRYAAFASLILICLAAANYLYIGSTPHQLQLLVEGALTTPAIYQPSHLAAALVYAGFAKEAQIVAARTPEPNDVRVECFEASMLIGTAQFPLDLDRVLSLDRSIRHLGMVIRALEAGGRMSDVQAIARKRWSAIVKSGKVQPLDYFFDKMGQSTQDEQNQTAQRLIKFHCVTVPSDFYPPHFSVLATEILIRLNRAQEAQVCAQTAADQPDADNVTLAAAAAIMDQSGNRRQADVLLDRALKWRPPPGPIDPRPVLGPVPAETYDPVAPLLDGLSRLELGDGLSSIESRLLSKSGDNADAFDLAHFYAEAERPACAALMVRRCLAFPPAKGREETRWWFSVARLARMQGLMTEARMAAAKSAGTVSTETPDSQTISLAESAAAFAEAGATDSGRSAVMQSLDLLPKIRKAYQSSESSTYAAYAALALHDPALARRAVASASQFVPALSGNGRDNLLCHIAIIYAGLGEFAQARAAAERISSWNTRLLAAGGILMQRGIQLNPKVAKVLDGTDYAWLRPAITDVWPGGIDPNLK